MPLHSIQQNLLVSILAAIFVITTYKIFFFITRDLDAYTEALEITERVALQTPTAYKSYLFHKPIAELIGIVSPDGDS